jgi:rod shape-determining protein MreD
MAMRWLSFFILAIVVLTLQSALMPRLELFGARPDLILVVVVFFAMHAERHNAVLTAWLLGMLADLMTIERFGLLALSYALVAMTVASVRDFLFRYNAFSQFVVTAVAAWLVGVGWFAYRHVMFDPGGGMAIEVLVTLVLTPLYTGLLAVPVHGAMLVVLRAFGVTPPRYTYTGLHKLEAGRV